MLRLRHSTELDDTAENQVNAAGGGNAFDDNKTGAGGGPEGSSAACT